MGAVRLARDVYRVPTGSDGAGRGAGGDGEEVEGEWGRGPDGLVGAGGSCGVFDLCGGDCEGCGGCLGVRGFSFHFFSFVFFFFLGGAFGGGRLRRGRDRSYGETRKQREGAVEGTSGRERSKAGGKGEV